MSRTSSTFRQPATAVWVWSMISLISAIGNSSRFMRNANATTVPEVEAELDAAERGDRDDRGERDRAEEVADREHQREVAPRLAVGEVELVHTLVQTVARAPFEAVRPDRRRAGDRLGELGEHVAGAGPDLVVRDQLAPLQEAQDRDHGQERDDRDQRQLPRVDRHHDQRPDDERAVHHPADRAPVHEAGERLDVARHARDQHAPLGLVLLGDAEPVDVLEHAHPERVQRALGGADEPEVRDAGEDHEHDHADRGAGAGPGDERGVEAVGAEHPLVEHLLDGHGDEQLPGRHRHREQEAHDDALADLGHDLARPCAAPPGHPTAGGPRRSPRRRRARRRTRRGARASGRRTRRARSRARPRPARRARRRARRCDRRVSHRRSRRGRRCRRRRAWRRSRDPWPGARRGCRSRRCGRPASG